VIITSERRRPSSAAISGWVDTLASDITAPVRVVTTVAGDVVSPIVQLSDQVTSGIKSTVDIFHPPVVTPPPPSNTPLVLGLVGAAALILVVALAGRGGAPTS
jgi:hypothetical protein